MRGDDGLVDDFAVDATGSWAEAGRELLHGARNLLAARGAAALRVVTARADRIKVEMLVSTGLVLAEQWWVRSLEANGSAVSIAADSPVATSVSPDVLEIPAQPVAGSLLPAPRAPPTRRSCSRWSRGVCPTSRSPRTW